MPLTKLPAKSGRQTYETAMVEEGELELFTTRSGIALCRHNTRYSERHILEIDADSDISRLYASELDSISSSCGAGTSQELSVLARPEVHL